MSDICHIFFRTVLSYSPHSLTFLLLLMKEYIKTKVVVWTKLRCNAQQTARACVYTCVHVHADTHADPPPELKWLSYRMLLLGDQTVSPQPRSNLNSDRYVPSALGMARTNIKGHVYLSSILPFSFEVRCHLLDFVVN